MSDRCPRCGSHRPSMHPIAQFGQPCADPCHGAVKSVDRLEAENLLLSTALRACLVAMKEAMKRGHLEYLNQDGDELYWDDATEKAKAALKTAGEP